jgi:hypothetical protein
MAPFMVSILAFSVSGKIEQYGAYAGFASVLGLAVLSLLYFAQAREVKRLREWAGRSPERAAELQDRVQTEAQRRAAAPPQPRHLPGHPQAAPAGAAAAPGAQPATAAGQAARVAPAGTPAAAAAAAATAAATAAGAATKVPVAPGGQPTTVQPAATPGANGSPPGPVAKPGQPLRVPPAQSPPPPTARAAAADGADDAPRRPILAIAGGVAALVAVVLVLVLVVFKSDGGNNTPPAPNTIGSAPAASKGSSPSSGKDTATATAKPGSYTIAVLNGTTTPGLARGVASRLQGAKFKTGTVTNAADQSHSATIVQFAPKHRGEALEVAKAIDVKSDAVQPLDQGARALAGTDAIVVVTVGQDQNVSPQTQQP